MNNILEKILIEKEKEVLEMKKQYPNGINLDNVALNSDYSFINNLNNSKNIQVIAEIKRGSPSKGLFAPDLDVVAQGLKYVNSNAAAISVLTDKKFFYGGFDDLIKLRPIVNLPILCKDFIIDEIQIDLAKSIGANIILLIVAAHNSSRLKELLDYATSKKMEVLVEVHNKEELDIALSLKHNLIGINNRDLKTFVTDIQVSLDLIKYVNDPSICLISESGIKDIDDVKKLTEAGFKGILVGESLIKNGIQGSLAGDITQVRRLNI